MYQLTRFKHVTALEILQHLFRSYGAIDEIKLKENDVKIMRAYRTSETLARLIYQLEKGRESARAERKTIANAMMVSKGIDLLAQTENFNDDIR